MQNIGKVAAIWARVSTEGQRELSLDGQVGRVRTKLEEIGYVVPPERVLAVDWTSMDLLSCAAFQTLRQWITNGQIKAVGIFDRDRLQAQGLQRLVFLSECKEKGVELVVAQGPGFVDGPEGQIVELALAIGKERANLRAQQGSSDGLSDRVKIKRLPASLKAPYGYRWNHFRFVPNDNYSVAHGIWRMLKDGKPDRYIAGALTKAGIPTPSGKQVWAPRTISGIACNPAYCGQYTGLRTRKVEPRRRYKDTYGKTGTARRPVEEQVVLEGLIAEPIVTPDEFKAMQERRATNKALGGKRVVDYLLRGIVVCGLCGRRATGTSNGQRTHPYAYYRGSRYSDPAGAPRCSNPPISARWLEDAVWGRICRFLQSPEVFMAQMGIEGETMEDTASSIRQTIGGLERQVREFQGYQQRALDFLVKGTTDEETYERTVAGYCAHVAWLEEEIGRQRADFERAESRLLRVESVTALYPRLREALNSADSADKRFVLESVQARVVLEAGQATLELAVPEDVVGAVGTTPRGDCGQ